MFDETLTTMLALVPGALAAIGGVCWKLVKRWAYRRAWLFESSIIYVEDVTKLPVALKKLVCRSPLHLNKSIMSHNGCIVTGRTWRIGKLRKYVDYVLDNPRMLCGSEKCSMDLIVLQSIDEISAILKTKV